MCKCLNYTTNSSLTRVYFFCSIFAVPNIPRDVTINFQEKKLINKTIAKTDSFPGDFDVYKQIAPATLIIKNKMIAGQPLQEPSNKTRCVRCAQNKFIH